MARHSLGRPSFSRPGWLEKKGANLNITRARPHDQETANRYNENDGVSTLVHEPAFGIVICFGLPLSGTPAPGCARKAAPRHAQSKGGARPAAPLHACRRALTSESTASKLRWLRCRGAALLVHLKLTIPSDCDPGGRCCAKKNILNL